jgi:hypothetical protein
MLRDGAKCVALSRTAEPRHPILVTVVDLAFPSRVEACTHLVSATSDSVTRLRSQAPVPLQMAAPSCAGQFVDQVGGPQL